MLSFCACNQQEANNKSQTVAQANQDDITTDNQVEATNTPVPTATVTPTPTATPTPTPTVIPVLTSIQVEAGSTSLEDKNFFATEEEIPTQEGLFVIEEMLTEEQLRQAGAVYEVPVSCAGKIVPVSVEIVDTTAPVIQNISDITVFVGDSVSYKKGVEVIDNADNEVTLTVDNSGVNLKQVGEYVVTYTATDSFGNVTVEEIKVVVNEISIEEKERRVNELADKVIAENITEGMSKWDICYKLWNWCRTNIRYGYSEGDRRIYAGAYEGLYDKTGDCYAYYATFTVLLQKCDIETMEVRRMGGTSDHWWNLVNVGDGWYHCDSSPRKKGDTYKCFMQTDAQVQAYTEYYTEKPNYYVFDTTLLPERGTTIVYGE